MKKERSNPLKWSPLRPSFDFDPAWFRLQEDGAAQIFANQLDLGHAALTCGNGRYEFKETITGQIHMLVGHEEQEISEFREFAEDFFSEEACLASWGKWAYKRFSIGSLATLPYDITLRKEAAEDASDLEAMLKELTAWKRPRPARRPQHFEPTLFFFNSRKCPKVHTNYRDLWLSSLADNGLRHDFLKCRDGSVLVRIGPRGATGSRGFPVIGDRYPSEDACLEWWGRHTYDSTKRYTRRQLIALMKKSEPNGPDASKFIEWLKIFDEATAEWKDIPGVVIGGKK